MKYLIGSKVQEAPTIRIGAVPAIGVAHCRCDTTFSRGVAPQRSGHFQAARPLAGRGRNRTCHAECRAGTGGLGQLVPEPAKTLVLRSRNVRVSRDHPQASLRDRPTTMQRLAATGCAPNVRTDR